MIDVLRFPALLRLRLLAGFMFLLGALGGGALQAQLAPMRFMADVQTYYNKDLEPYLQLNFSVGAPGLSLRKVEGGWQGVALLQLELRALPAGNTIFADRILLSTPVYTDTSAAERLQLLLHNQYVTVEPGDYQLYAWSTDYLAEAPDTLESYNEFTAQAYSRGEVLFSDILLLDGIGPKQENSPFNRHGMELRPLVSNGFLEDRDSLGFLVEYYGLNRVYLEEAYCQACLFSVNASPGEQSPWCTPVRKVQPQLRAAQVERIALKNTPSGTYELRFTIGRQPQDPFADPIAQTGRRVFIYNSELKGSTPRLADAYQTTFNLSEEELDKYLPTLEYIANSTEESFLQALRTREEKQAFFYNFWKKRGKAEGQPPLKLWANYRKRVDYANQEFGAPRNSGWKSDRGRILLTYGPPNDIQSYPYEQELVPYEIWTYNSLQGQAGVFFVFADRTLAGNSYSMIHSTLVGEVFNSGWRSQLIKTQNVGIPDYTIEEAPQVDPFLFPDDKVIPGVGTGQPR